MTVNVDGSGSFDAVLGVFGEPALLLYKRIRVLTIREMGELRLKLFMV